jgi:hypothetical protein
MRSIKLPLCCKTYFIYDFPYDNPWYNKEDKVWREKKTKDSIKNIVNRRLIYRDNHFIGINLAFIANVSHEQKQAKAILEDLGFDLINIVDNKKSTGSTVWVYSKTLSTKERL